MATLPSGVTKNTETVDGQTVVTYTYNGATYDLASHTVHIHVQGNRSGDLVATVAYDESSQGDVTTGTRFTPVVVNTYAATAERQPNVSKLLLTRAAGEAWGTGTGKYSEFFFVQHGIGGAPFVPTPGQARVYYDATSEADAISKLRSGSYDAAYTGDAMYTRVTNTDPSKTDTLRYIPTTDATPQDGTTYYVLSGGDYVAFTGSAFETGVTYYVATEQGGARYQPSAKIQFTIADLDREVTSPTELTYSDGETNVPVGHKYGIFEYSFNEVVPATGAYDTLAYDTTTQYSRIIVIDRGDGTLDMLTQYADGQIGKEIQPNAGVTIYNTTTSSGEAQGAVGKAQFTNSEVMGVDVTKQWVDEAGNPAAAAYPVTFQLYRTSRIDWTNNEESAKAARESKDVGIDPNGNETQGWVAVEGEEVTIPVGAYGEDLTAKFSTMPLYDTEGRRYIYRVKEVGVEKNDGDNYTYKDESGKILYKLEEYGFNPGDAGDRHFTAKNTTSYVPAGTARLNVVKELDGRTWRDADDFEFVVTATGKSDFQRATTYSATETYYTLNNGSYVVATVADQEAFEAGTYYVATITSGAAGVPMPHALIDDSEGRQPGAEGYVPTYAGEVSDTASALGNDPTPISAMQRQARFEQIHFTQDDLIQVGGLWQRDFHYAISEQVGNTGKTVAELADMSEQERTALDVKYAYVRTGDGELDAT